MSNASFESYMREHINPYRKRKAAPWANLPGMHFHKLREGDVLYVTSLLRSILRARLAAKRDRVSIIVDDAGTASLIDFIAQLQFAYVHPRSTSLRVSFAAEKRSSAMPTT